MTPTTDTNELADRICTRIMERAAEAHLRVGSMPATIYMFDRVGGLRASPYPQLLCPDANPVIAAENAIWMAIAWGAIGAGVVAESARDADGHMRHTLSIRRGLHDPIRPLLLHYTHNDGERRSYFAESRGRMGLHPWTRVKPVTVTEIMV